MPRWRGSDVTVVTATIEGREEMLARCKESVHAQKVRPAEHLVVKDEERRGAWWARNLAVEAVQTEWICWGDDDDWVDDNHVQVLLRWANRLPRAWLLYTYPKFHGIPDPLAVCQGGTLIPEPINVPFGYQQAAHLDSRKHVTCPFCGYGCANFIPLGYLVRTELVRSAGGFPRPGSYGAASNGECEDQGLLLAMLDELGGDYDAVHHIPGVKTWHYNWHGGNTRGQGIEKGHARVD